MTEPSAGSHGRRLLALLSAGMLVVVGVAWAATRPASEAATTTEAATPSPAALVPSGTPSGSMTVPSAPTAELGSLALGGRVDGPVAAIGGSGPVALGYAFDVADAGGRLRATLDLSNRDDCLTLELFDPSGVSRSEPAGDYPVVCPHQDRSGQSFGVELSVADATPGRWTARVLVEDALDLTVRLRATLEDGTSPSENLLYPDLVPWLPAEFGFAAPGSADPGTARDRDNGPGDPTVSCHPEEEPHDTRCLRFSAGVYNVGDGPMYVAFRDDLAIQHVYSRDDTPLDHTDNERRGDFEEELAGRGEWHPFHEHRHLAEFVLYELFAVHDDGTLLPLDTGGKHGYCTFSQQILDWSSTAQDPQYASFPEGVFCDDAMTLERGWGDVYRWQRPGQYLAYDAVTDPDGSMTAGSYLVRVTVDPAQHIAETDETNNVGYARLEVVDGGGPGQDTVVLCGQAMGSDPMAPDATAVDDRFAWTSADPAATCD